MLPTEVSAPGHRSLLGQRRRPIRTSAGNCLRHDERNLIGDVPAATAILDRFLHNAEVIAITGKSYRLRHPPAKDAPGQHPRRSNTRGHKDLNRHA
ncbi:MAG TPA: ATP-binding protein [Phycisphaerae bacterium]